MEVHNSTYISWAAQGDHSVLDSGQRRWRVGEAVSAMLPAVVSAVSACSSAADVPHSHPPHRCLPVKENKTQLALTTSTHKQNWYRSTDKEHKKRSESPTVTMVIPMKSFLCWVLLLVDYTQASFTKTKWKDKFQESCKVLKDAAEMCICSCDQAYETFLPWKAS